MSNITIEHCGMEGSGHTVTLAKQDATRKIRKALCGLWTVRLLTHAGRTAVIMRTPIDPERPWGYKVLHAEDASGQDLHIDCNDKTAEDATRAAARHLAQLAGSYAGLERWMSQQEQAGLDRYFAWQAAYAAAHVQGLSDQESRTHADRALRTR